MKKNRIIALSLSLAMVLGASGVTALAADKKEEATGASKEETVYVIANPDGSSKETIVSEHLLNPDEKDTLKDTSSLSDISVVKGDAEYTEGTGDALTWTTNGKDVYYQGSTEQELPVNVKISYKLDGKDISAEDLAGKSGKVTIRFDYENKQYETVKLDGKDEKIYVPFAVMTGMLLDNDRFSNVTVSNGKLLDDGDRTSVVGIAFPGMQENLDIDKEDLEIPNYVEVTADVENFELETTLTLATNSIFSDLSDEEIDKGDLDSLTDSLTQMTDAMTQLTDGSSELYDGLCTLLEKSGELANGVDALASGLSTLNSNSSALNDGAKQVFDTLLAAANSQIKAAGLSVPELTIDNYQSVLDNAIGSISGAASNATGTARDQVTAAVRAQEPAIRAAVTQAVSEQVTAGVTAQVRDNVWQQVLAEAGLTQETYDAGVAAGQIDADTQAQLSTALEAQMASADVQALISANVAQQMEAQQSTIDAQTEAKIQTLINQNMSSADVQSQISAATAAAASGVASLQALRSQLDSYNTFYQGLLTYTAGVASACNGAKALQSNMPALTDGVTQLRDGAMELSDGLKQFNEEGVQKLVDAVDGDLAGLADRVQTIREVSEHYNTFSGLADGMTGSVKFIWRTEAIEA